jgi:hypothetical protein
MPLCQPPCACGASIPRRFADDNGDNISNGHDNLKIAVFRARWRAGGVRRYPCVRKMWEAYSGIEIMISELSLPC